MEKILKVENRSGLHARPASLFVQAANKFAAKLTLEKNGKTVDAKSIIGIMSLGVGNGESVTLKAEGADAAEAVATLTTLVAERFGESA